MPRVSSIDISLVGRPRVRAQLKSLLDDRGVSIQVVRDALKKAGIESSRSGAARWVLAERRRSTNASATLLAAIIRKVTELDESGLEALARRLRVRPTKR